MAGSDLSQSLIEAGAALLAATDALSMQAQGAMWVYDHSQQEWRYYLVTSLVDTIGRRKTYKLLIEAFEKGPLPESMTIDDVYLGSPSDTLFKAIAPAIGVVGGVVTVRDCVFNGVEFDGVIYRSVNEAPSVKEAEKIEKKFSKRVKEHSKHVGRTAARGLYRIIGGWGAVENSAMVDYDSKFQLEVPESQYRASGHQPPFGELPTQKEYNDAAAREAFDNISKRATKPLQNR